MAGQGIIRVVLADDHAMCARPWHKSSRRAVRSVSWARLRTARSAGSGRRGPARRDGARLQHARPRRGRRHRVAAGPLAPPQGSRADRPREHSLRRQGARERGAGYVVKSAAVGELVEAIQAVSVGECYISPKVSQRVIEHFAGRAATALAWRRCCCASLNCCGARCRHESQGVLPPPQHQHQQPRPTAPVDGKAQPAHHRRNHSLRSRKRRRWLRGCERTPPPGPLPETERGRKKDFSVFLPPLRFGEGAGGGVLSQPLTPLPLLAPRAAVGFFLQENPTFADRLLLCPAPG